jgi:arylsulfatase A-like enzyme
MKDLILVIILILMSFSQQNISRLFAGEISTPTQSHPNIILIMTDDHAKNAVSCYGSKINQTPNIDRLAHEGIRFDNSFVTNSICAPSRAVILTGKYSHINGLKDNRDRFNGDQMTFPKLLQKAGYQTAMIGKWHLKSPPQGFNTWKILPGQGDYYNPRFIENGDTVRYEGYATNLITDFSIETLDDFDKGKPFCLLYFHKAPHRNWMPDTKHLTLYDDVEIPLPETFFDDYSTRSAAAREQDMEIINLFTSTDMKIHMPEGAKDYSGGSGADNFNAPKWWARNYNSMTEEQRKAWDAAYEPKNKAFAEANLSGKELAIWKYQRYIKDYLRCVTSVDENIGRLLDYLDKNGLTDNTIIIYTSDQGFYLGEHGWYDKRFMYEESLGMPLIVRYPKEIKPGSISDEIVMNLDFCPTFLDYAGIKIPEDVQGESLRPLLNGQTPDTWRDAMYYHYYEYPHGWHFVKRHYGIRTKTHKLIHFYHDIDAYELYDLKNDPNELNNIYGKSELINIQKELKNELANLRTYYGDVE